MFIYLFQDYGWKYDYDHVLYPVGRLVDAFAKVFEVSKPLILIFLGFYCYYMHDIWEDYFRRVWRRESAVAENN